MGGLGISEMHPHLRTHMDHGRQIPRYLGGSHSSVATWKYHDIEPVPHHSSDRIMTTQDSAARQNTNRNVATSWLHVGPNVISTLFPIASMTSMDEQPWLTERASFGPSLIGSQAIASTSPCPGARLARPALSATYLSG